MRGRFAIALLLPFIAAGMQWLLWDPWIKPYVWFLFFPTAFFSAWIGGWRGGLAATLISALLVWFVFIAPQFSFVLEQTSSIFSIIVFILQGGLFAWMFERLRRAQALARAGYDATVDQAAVGIALLSPDGRWLRVNRKLSAIVGYTPDELMRKTFQDITHPDDLNADLDQVRRMLAKEIDTYSMEKRYLCKDGSLVWVNLTVALVWKPDNTPDYFISVVEDISARKAAEVALIEREKQLREANRLAALGHWHWDLRTNTHIWSDEIYAFYGRDPSLAPAVYPEVQKYFTTESWNTLAVAVEQGMSTGRPYECDAEVVRPDGTHRWITARGQSIQDADGKVVALYGTVQDITVRKQAEIELKRRNEELERFDRASIGREQRMIELKREVNALTQELGRKPPYDLSFADNPASEKTQ